MARCGALLLLLLAAAEARVKLLKTDTFDAALEADGHLFVMFYAPWCQHSKELKPVFDEASRRAHKEDPTIQFAKVDATKHEQLAKKYHVVGYPALRFFKERETQPIDADNIERNPEELAAYAVRVAKAPDRVVQLEAGKAIKSFITDMTTGNEVGVLGFFEDDEAADMFIEAASTFRYPVRFAWTTKPYARKYLELENDTAINLAIMYKPFDEGRHEYGLNNTKQHSKTTKTGMAEMMNKMMGVPLEEALKLMPEPEISKNFKSWIQTLMIPLVVPFMEGYMNLIFTGPLQLHSIIVVDPDEDNEELEQVLVEVAKRQRGNFLHIIMPTHESTDEMREYFGIADRALPTAVISDMRSVTEEEPRGTQFLFPEGETLTLDTLSAFEQDFLDGKLSAKGEDGPRKSKKKKKAPKKSDSVEL